MEIKQKSENDEGAPSEASPFYRDEVLASSRTTCGKCGSPEPPSGWFPAISAGLIEFRLCSHACFMETHVTVATPAGGTKLQKGSTQLELFLTNFGMGFTCYADPGRFSTIFGCIFRMMVNGGAGLEAFVAPDEFAQRNSERIQEMNRIQSILDSFPELKIFKIRLERVEDPEPEPVEPEPDLCGGEETLASVPLSIPPPPPSPESDGVDGKTPPNINGIWSEDQKETQSSISYVVRRNSLPSSFRPGVPRPDTPPPLSVASRAMMEPQVRRNSWTRGMNSQTSKKPPVLIRQNSI